MIFESAIVAAKLAILNKMNVISGVKLSLANFFKAEFQFN